LKTFEADFNRHPDSGVHAAAEWALRKWGSITSIEYQADSVDGAGIDSGRSWFVNKQGQTMIVLTGPVNFQIGSPGDEPGRDGKDEWSHPVHIGRSFAISSHEVSMDRFLRFRSKFKHSLNDRAPEKQCPVNAVTWVDAVKYCQWLSKQEGIAKEQWPYPADIPVEPGMTLPDNFIDRTGYRLPTESEWEYACRAGTLTRFSYGNDTRLLSSYAWYLGNSQGRTWPIGSLKPNAFGFFDMHGNVKEWCHDIYWDQTEREDLGETEPYREKNQNVMKGGAYSAMAKELRSANRRGDYPRTHLHHSAGFRVARTHR
jgi:hypothetical protein